MLHAPPAIDWRRFTSMAGGQGWRRCDPTGCFLPSCRALAQGGTNQRQSRSLPPGAAATRAWVLLVDGVWARPSGKTTPAAAVAASSAPPRSSATDHAGWAAPAHWRGGFEPKQVATNLSISTPALAHRTAISAASKGSPPMLSALGGALARWQTMGGHSRRRRGDCRSSSATQVCLQRDLHQAPIPATSGRVTVHCSWDKEKGRIVDNESSEITDVHSAFNEHRR